MNASVKEIEALFDKFQKGVKAQNEWDTQVWGSFSKEQIANMKNIEKSLDLRVALDNRNIGTGCISKCQHENR